MILYHGSNIEVAAPRILASDRKLDFGPGFYLTGSLSQAERWAQLTTARRETGYPIVTAYEFSEESLAQLKTLVFERPDDQYAFKTDKALSCISLREVIRL